MKRFTLLVLAASILLCGCGLNVSRGDNVTDSTNDVTVTEPSVGTDAADTSANAYEVNDDVPEEELTPIYDTTAVLDAYRSGDPSPLSEMDKVIYDGAISAIAEFYRDDMTEAEIVTAAHDWIVENITYDEAALLAIPKKTPDTENPYGVFTIRQGICMGYTTTFQLFMDMLGVNSQIVRGTASDGLIWEEHAWNLVEIDGKYYHVDTTWDDFVPDEVGRPAFHMYLLVPDYVMECLHSWDRDNTPKAESDDLIYYKTHGLWAENRSESAAILDAAAAAGQWYCEIMTPDENALSYRHVMQYWVNDFTNYTVTIYWLK